MTIVGNSSSTEKRRRRSGRVEDLSPREREVFEHAIRCRSNDEIAKKMGITRKTVETHRARVNRILGVHTAAQLVLFAARNGLIRAET